MPAHLVTELGCIAGEKALEVVDGGMGKGSTGWDRTARRVSIGVRLLPCHVSAAVCAAVAEPLSDG
jgi:hypothetical protein